MDGRKDPGPQSDPRLPMSQHLQYALAAGVCWAACAYLLLTSLLDFRASGEIRLLSYRLVDNDALALVSVLSVISVLLLAFSFQQLWLHLKNRNKSG